MRTTIYILGFIASLVVLAMVLSWPSDADMVEHRRIQHLVESCETMLADASPGSEKRTTRELCQDARRQRK